MLDEPKLVKRMEQNDYSAGPSRAVSQRTELINLAVVGIVADAWNRYPSEVSLPKVGIDEQQLLGQVLGLFAQEGVVRITDGSVALTLSGYAAVEQAGRVDPRVSELLKGASPSEEFGSSSLVLAILRAQFERRSKSKG